MQTARAHLSLLTPSDFPEILKMFLEKDTFKYIQPLQNLSQHEYIDFLEFKLLQIEKREGYYWVARSLKDRAYIGSMNLTPFKDSNRIQLGFQLKRNYWGQGFATELSREVLRFGLHIWRLPIIYGYYNENHLASHKIFAKLGFQFLEKLSLPNETSDLIVVKYDNPNLKN